MAWLTSIALTLFLTFVTINLTGMVVRGFFRNSTLEKLKRDEKTLSFIKDEIGRYNKFQDLGTIVFVVISIMFLALIYHYFNVQAMIAILLLVASRIPDLVWEIKSGRKTTLHDGAKGGLYTFTGYLTLVAIPFLWWSIYTH